MILHCSMTKAFLRREIKRHGAAAVLQDCRGLTDTELLYEIDRDPREAFVVGTCDNQNTDGTCAGHPSPADSTPQ